MGSTCAACQKVADLELKAGYKAERGQRGAAYAYNIKSHRDQERRWVEQAETAYARFVAGWNPRGPKQAPVRERKIASISQESTCRSHQSSKGGLGLVRR